MLKLPLTLALIASVGCRKDPPPAPHSKVQVLTAGAGPGQLLRYRVATGARHRMELVLDVDLDVDGVGGPLPSLVLIDELAIGAARPDGGFEISTTIADVTARDRPGSSISASSMTAQTAMMRGLVLTAVLSPDGLVTDTKIDAGGRALPPGLTSQLDTLARSLEQVALPLPATAVGPGATWLYTTRLDQGGILMTTATTVTLTSIDDDRLAFTSTTRATGEDQTITQAGTTLRVTDIEGTGRGAGTVDLSRLAMTGELSAELGAHMASGGESSRMGMKIVTRFRPLDATDATDATAPATPPSAPPASDGGAGATDAGAPDADATDAGSADP